MRSAFALYLGLAACAGSVSAEAPQAEALATGRDCALATGACGGGRCSVEIDNGCDTPVTCQLRIESQCQTAGGDVGPANASTKHVTQLASTKNVLEAQTNCGQGTAVATKVEALTCI